MPNNYLYGLYPYYFYLLYYSIALLLLLLCLYVVTNVIANRTNVYSAILYKRQKNLFHIVVSK